MATKPPGVSRSLAQSMKPTLQSRLTINTVDVALVPSRIWWSTEFRTLSTTPAGMHSSPRNSQARVPT